VQISNGRICAILGPDGGSVPDITSLRNHSFAFLATMEPLEILLADKGYQGHWKSLTPFKGRDRTPEEDAFNEIIASVRMLVECVIQRIKIFGVLGGKGRFHAEKTKHRVVFNVCCQITNISIMREPVWIKRNWYL
jgi:hypothetical protein